MTASYEELDKRNAVWWLVLALVVGMALAVGLHYVQGAYLGRGYPFSTFLFRPNDLFEPNGPRIGNHAFGDFYATWQHSKDGSPYLAPSLSFPSNYFPFTHLLLKPLTWIPYRFAFLLFFGTMLAVLPALFYRQLRDLPVPLATLGAFVIGLVNYPVLFLLDRGNVEGIILLLLMGAGLAARAKRWLWVAVLVAAAGAMKGFPLVFVLVLVAHRQWKWAIASVLGAAALTLAGLASMTGGVTENARGLRRGLGAFEASAGSEAGLQHSSSLRGLLAVAGREVAAFAGLVEASSVLALVLLAVGSLACLSGRLITWEVTAVCAALMVLVPSVAYDYRLAHLLVPVLLLMQEPAGSSRAAGMALLGAVLVPKGLPVLFGEVNIATVINPLLLLALVVGLAAVALRRLLMESRVERPA